jgi:hypothetical protein
MINENINEIFCECGLIFNENEFTKHYRHCKILSDKYKNFDFKFTQLLKVNFNSTQSLTILKFLFKKYIQIFDQKINSCSPETKTIDDHKKKNEDIKYINYNKHEELKSDKNDQNSGLSILTTFIEIYPQKAILDGEKAEIYKYIYKKNNIEKDLNKILVDIQMLYSFLIKERKDVNEPIHRIITKIPQYILISEVGQNFFNEFSDFTIENSYEVFLFIELLFSNSIFDDLRDDYKEDLDKKLEDDIKYYFSNKIPKLIGKEILSNAFRKATSRYLIGPRPIEDFSPDTPIFPYLNRREFWDEEIIRDDKDSFEKELKNIADLNIKFKHIFKLCLLLDKDNVMRKKAIEKIEKKNDSNSESDK